MAAPALPAEIQKLREQLTRDQAPSARTRTEFFDPNVFVSRHGRPYSSLRLPISTLVEMRTDAILRFAQLTALVSIFSAKWRIECGNARKAEFIDQALRRVIGRLIVQFFESWNFGWQALVKEFGLMVPSWEFIDRDAEGGPAAKPVWDGGPEVPALVWEPFVPLRPHSVAPVWTAGGAFNGIAIAKSGVSGAYAFPTTPIAPGDIIDVPHDIAVFFNDQDQTQRKVDLDHCSPPDEMILTANRGPVQMGDLAEDDRLVVWDKKQKRMNRVRGYAFEKAVRPYSGPLLTISAGGSSTRVTPNHKMTVRWTAEAEEKKAVYLMRKGDWWRIGVAAIVTRRAGVRTSGVAHRVSAEEADAAWVLGIFDTKNEALYHEKLWSCQYGIPDMVFQDVQAGRSEACLKTTQLETIWGQIDTGPGARELLSDRGLDEEMPLYTHRLYKNRAKTPRGPRGWTCAAANLVSGMMEVPVDIGRAEASWEVLGVETEHYEGDVVSIEVPPHHHYVSGSGIIVQNSLWVVNERDSQWGSIWGYPRLGYAYKYWWSAEMTLGILNRSVERKGDPTIVVTFPQGSSSVNGQDIPNQTIAFDIGNKARSGSVLVVPSEVWGEDTGTSNQASKWSVTYLKAEENFDQLTRVLDYFDTMRFRSMLVSELALAEGSGGCLEGDTPILCPRDHAVYPDGVPLEDIEPGRLVWAFNQESMRFELWPVKGVWCTMDDADLYKLTLDDGQEITGTPDHPFMSRDGVWRRMDELKPGDRLMPFYESGREISYSGAKLPPDDYEPMVLLDPDHGSFEVEYRAIGEYLGWTGQGARVNIHHDDGRHANTELDNLHCLTPGQHATKHFRDPVHRAKHSDAVRAAMAALSPEKKARMNKEHWDEERWKAFSERQAIVGLESITKFRDSLTPEEYKAWCTSRAKARQDSVKKPVPPPRDKRVCRRCSKDFQPRSSNSWYCQTCNETRNTRKTERLVDYEPGATNHRVASVERLGETGAVWDLEIDGPEHVRAFVAGGVVVHNTSSRNVAATTGERTAEAQIFAQTEWDEIINRYMIPQLADANFPELKDEPARKVTQAFGQDEAALAADLLRSFANSDATKLPVDLPALLKRFQIDSLEGDQLAEFEKKLVDQAENSQPPVVPAQPNGAAGTADTGFGVHYYDAPERIELEDALLASLPKTKHYSDRTILTQTRRVRRLWFDLLSAQYEDFASHVAGLDLAESKAEKIVGAWRYTAKKYEQTVKSLSKSMSAIFARAGAVELSSSKLDPDTFDPTADALSSWVTANVAAMVRGVEETTRKQLASFLSREFERESSPEKTADAIREHFADFPAWRADLIAREETKRFYNAATLFAAEAAGTDQVQALDAQDGPTDPECHARNGRLFSVQDAWRESAREHVRGTLGWRILPPNVQLCLRYVSRDETRGVAARIDPGESIIHLVEGLAPDVEGQYLDQVVSWFIATR